MQAQQVSAVDDAEGLTEDEGGALFDVRVARERGTERGHDLLVEDLLNAGGGVSWAFRPGEVFLESRYVTTYMPSERASYVPIILGVNVY